MTRTNLKLKRFASWISHTSEIAPQFAKRRLISLRRGYLPGILFLPVVMQLCAVSAAAQLSIVILEKNRRRIALPTTEVTRIAGATRGAPRAITVVPMKLEVGDELIGNSGVIAVRVRCNLAEAALSGKFRVRMLPSPPRECNLYFEGTAGARISTTASGPTNVVSGAFTLGTRRTRYEIEIPDKKGGGLLGSLTSRAVLPIAKVYEGEAMVNSPGFSGAVKEGQKLVAEGLTGVIRKIAPEDYQRTAQLHAALDVSQASLANEKELEAAYKKLLGLHRDVLENPGDLSKLTALQRTQEEFGVPKSDPAGPKVFEVTLKPNEKRVVGFPSINNVCGNVITVRLSLNNASFVRLVSTADLVVSPGGRAEWQLEFDATGLKRETYAAGIELSCVDCANTQCQINRQLLWVRLNVL